MPGDFKKFFNKPENDSLESDDGSLERASNKYQNNESLEKSETKRDLDFNFSKTDHKIGKEQSFTQLKTKKRS